MPDLAALLMRAASRSARPRRRPRAAPTAAARRWRASGCTSSTPGAGCASCASSVPEERRLGVRSERVHASDRPLSVVPKAA